MSKGQRFTFLGIAGVIAVVAAIVLGTSGGDDEKEAGQGQTAPAQTQTAEPTVTLPVETETPTAEPTPEPPPLLRPGSEQDIEVDKGDTVEFRVRSDTADHVHVHGYDILKDVAPGKTVTISFEATITGIFEIELEEARESLATLTVNP